jgi:hypothetical protein
MQRRRVAPVFAVFALVAATARADQIDDYVRGNDVDMPAVGNGLADLYLASEGGRAHPGASVSYSVRSATSGSTRVARRAGR